MNYPSWSKPFKKFRILGVIFIFGFLRSVEMIKGSEEFIKSMRCWQVFIQVTQMIFSKQSALAVTVSVGLLGLDVNGPVWLLGVVAVVDAVLGTALGLAAAVLLVTRGQSLHIDSAYVPGYAAALGAALMMSRISAK